MPLFDRNRSIFEILLRDIAMKSLNYQVKLMTLVMVYIQIGAKGNILILTIRHQHAESCKHWSYSVLFCDSNVQSETVTYAAHLYSYLV